MKILTLKTEVDYTRQPFQGVSCQGVEIKIYNPQSKKIRVVVKYEQLPYEGYLCGGINLPLIGEDNIDYEDIIIHIVKALRELSYFQEGIKVFDFDPKRSRLTEI